MKTRLSVTVFLLLKLHVYRRKKKLTDPNVILVELLIPFHASSVLPTSRSANFTTERIVTAASKITATSFIFVDTFSKGNVDFFCARGPITSWIPIH